MLPVLSWPPKISGACTITHAVCAKTWVGSLSLIRKRLWVSTARGGGIRFPRSPTARKLTPWPNTSLPVPALRKLDPGRFFHPRAITLLKSLLLAAALGGYCLRDVQRWLANPDTEESEPYVALKNSLFPEVLNEFSGILAADSGRKPVCSAPPKP